ncbi:MAG: DDE-type integrase/transposase/recombinase [Rickettsia endosymbiont of Argas persicus]
MNIKIKGEVFILWRAVDSKGHELEILLQKRRNKKSAIRFLSRLLGNYPTPRVIVTDKLRSYIKPIKLMCPNTEHRTSKRLNNCVENAHQPTRRKEKILIKFKHPNSAQCILSLMGKVRNIFAVTMLDDILKPHQSKELHLHPLNLFGTKLLKDFLLPEI